MHDCFQCGRACYCHGDIDDIQVETTAYAYEHCEGCGCNEYEFDEEFYHYDEDYMILPPSGQPA